MKDVEYKVRVGSDLGDPIKTNIGGPQGDCLSALLFTFYLAKSLSDENNNQEHNYAKPSSTPSVGDIAPKHLEDHNYTRSSEYIDIDQQYADDTGWATTNIGTLNHVKRKISTKLKARNPNVNEEKNETIWNNGL